jgi:ATP-dependent DNA helicase RecQ
MESFDEALANVLKTFGIGELKKEQKLILDALMNSKDCVGILPTGYGKSLPYQLVLPLKRSLNVNTDSSEEKIIVCCPLVALMQDQVNRLNGIQGITAVYKGNFSGNGKNFSLNS